ncbi:MAG: 4Fe-4S binding protein [Flavobacteriaceae bacterium]|nr:4Fe-4S binding protein [Flavobacteriaceae bacterium]
MKLLRIIGLFLFITSVLIFTGTIFIGNYTLSESSIRKALTSKKETTVNAFITVVKEEKVLDKPFNNQHLFINKVTELIKKSNKSITDKIAIKKGLTASEIEKITQLSTVNNQVNYSKELLQQLFLKNPDKIQAIDNATNWMYTANKKYAKIVNFKNDFNAKVADINRNNAQEFLLYDNKYLRFDLTKLSATGIVSNNKLLFLFLTFGLGIIGSLLFIISALFLKPIAGIRNDGIYLQAATNRGWVGMIVFGFLVLFYIVLYFYPYILVNLTNILDPVKQLFIKNETASHWFLYGILYTTSMFVMGIRMLIKYRHNQYQIFRTISVLFFQVIFAFLLVEILPIFDLPAVDLKNAWPLDYNFYTDWNIKNHLNAGHLGKFMLIWGILFSLIIIPILVYFYGKRWYCSWVCGCGGLAETLGDPYRQLSDKRLFAWKIERWIIYPVLLFAIIMTIVVGYNTYTIIYNPAQIGNNTLFGINAYKINEWYGFLIGSIFAGVIGTGFYPILGNRTWCRFGCPLAAYMGIIQRFKSRFRITTNGGQCISCGNCSTYCEQGIDVRAYAQKGENIVRSSCVGCGICSAVCPRGVLKLENGPEEGRINPTEILLGNDIDLMKLINNNNG